MAEAGGKPPRSWRPFGILVGLIAIPLIIIDQLSKLYVASHMALYESIAVVPNWFDHHLHAEPRRRVQHVRQPAAWRFAC